jgi:hypothetical protein
MEFDGFTRLFRKLARFSENRVGFIAAAPDLAIAADYAVLALKVAPRPHCFLKFPFDLRPLVGVDHLKTILVRDFVVFGFQSEAADARGWLRHVEILQQHEGCTEASTSQPGRGRRRERTSLYLCRAKQPLACMN